MFFTKKDAYKSLIVGFAVSLLMLIVIKNLSIELPVSKYWLPVLFTPLMLIGLYVAFLIGKIWRPFVYQFGKFFVIGLLNTFLDLGVLNMLIFFTSITHGIYFSVFKGISFLCAVINSYFWNKYWSFQKQGSFGLFFLVVSGSALLNVGWATYLVEFVNPPDGITPKMWDNIAALSSVFLVMTWNYLGMKFIVFRKKLDSRS